MRDTVTAKLIGLAILVALAEWLFVGGGVGAIIGGFALAWAAVLIATRRAVRRGIATRIAVGMATGFALALIDDPNILALLLFGVALNLATLLPRRRFDDAISWGWRLARQGIGAPFAPLRDLTSLRRVAPARTGIARTLVLPAIGGVLFLALFAAANPIIADWLSGLTLIDSDVLVGRSLLAAIVGALGWATLRPARRATAIHPARWQDSVATLAPSPATLTLSLVTFNAIFAVQNALDIAFLWRGAALPAGVTMADYAHRGAYALIVTALLAAAFVLIAFRSGAPHSPTARRLVGIWIAQNLLLVASSALRTLDYVDAYGWTVLRLAALAWMALVACGLALIFWRIARARSARWLINANALAAALVLTLSSVVDYGALAASLNAHVALAKGKDGPPLDITYMRRLGASALIPLATLEIHAKGAALRHRLACVRWRVQADTARAQRDWRRWTFRDYRRLNRVEAMRGTTPPAHGRCDARLTSGAIR